MLLNGLLKDNTPPIFPNQKREGWCQDKNGNPIQKRIILINQLTGQYIGSCISRSSDGYWIYVTIDITIPNNCILEVAIDDTGQYEAVVRSFKSRIQ